MNKIELDTGKNWTFSYRYAFQGQERDDEVKGAGNSYNYTYRMHDSRLGRFFAVDPLFREYPELSTYQFSSNRLVDSRELEGLEAKNYQWWLNVSTDENRKAQLDPIDKQKLEIILRMENARINGQFAELTQEEANLVSATESQIPGQTRSTGQPYDPNSSYKVKCPSCPDPYMSGSQTISINVLKVPEFDEELGKFDDGYGINVSDGETQFFPGITFPSDATDLKIRYLSATEADNIRILDQNGNVIFQTGMILTANSPESGIPGMGWNEYEIKLPEGTDSSQLTVTAETNDPVGSSGNVEITFVKHHDEVK